jgi:hypothetical protein
MDGAFHIRDAAETNIHCTSPARRGIPWRGKVAASIVAADSANGG